MKRPLRNVSFLSFRPRPRSIVLSGLLLPLLFFLLGTTGEAQEAEDRILIVGTKQAPPFAIKDDDGAWSGIGIELWRAIADELQLSYEFRELDLQSLLDGVTDGSLDAAVGALTITAERETVMDFTHPFHTTGLGVAVARQRGQFGFIWQFVSFPFLKVVAALGLVLLVVGALIWACERRQNPQHFGGNAKGVLSGLWWAAVTMTTVGYGDKVPVTIGGRIIGLLWMFTAIILISGFTASITTALTVSHFESSILSPQDLEKARVVTLSGSTSEAYLRRRHIVTRDYATLEAGLAAVEDGKMDALVYDAPLLRYTVLTGPSRAVEVLPFTFQRQDYGIALPSGSPLREPINRVLLKKIKHPDWGATLNRYLGTEQ